MFNFSRISAGLLCLFLLCTVLPTQPGFAEDIAEAAPLKFENLGPSGGLPEVATFHPKEPGLVVAAGRNGGIFLSTDAGNTWKNISGNMITGLRVGAIAFDPANPQRLIVGGTPQGSMMNGHYYLTEDQGVTWKAIGKKIQGSAPVLVDIHPTNPQDIIVVNRNPGNVWRSKDGGKSFKNTFKDLGSIYSAHRHLAQPDTLYLGTAANGKSKHVLYVSDNGGDQFKGLLAKFPLKTGAKATSSIATHAKNPRLIYATNYGSAYLSTDAGKNWKVLFNAIDTRVGGDPTSMEFIIPDPSNPKRVYGPTWNGLMVSNNLGASFKPLNQERGLLVLSPDAKQQSLFFSRRKGVFASSRPSSRWKEHSPEGLYLQGSSALHTVYTSEASYLLTAAPMIQRMNTETMKWTPIKSSPTRVQAILSHPGDQDHLFALSTLGVWISKNAGKTWTASRSNKIKDFSVMGGTWLGEELFLATRLGVYVMNPKTGRAEQVSEDNSNQITTINQEELIINTFSQGLKISKNKGVTWQKLDKAPGTTKLFRYPDDPSVVWAMGRFGIWRYQNGKLEQMNKGLISISDFGQVDNGKKRRPSPIKTKTYYIGAMAHDGNDLYAVGTTGLYRFNNEKEVWVPVAVEGLRVVRPNGMHLEGNALYISDPNLGVFRTLLP